jgi:hypothetical protein
MINVPDRQRVDECSWLSSVAFSGLTEQRRNWQISAAGDAGRTPRRAGSSETADGRLLNPRRWVGRSPNPRPADYESIRPPLTCIASDLQRTCFTIPGIRPLEHVFAAGGSRATGSGLVLTQIRHGKPADSGVGTLP